MSARSRSRSCAARSRGLTLVELMVAIALGAILLGGAVSLFVNNRATYEVTNDMARLQENARFALQLMVQDIRMSGYVGCVNNVAVINNNTGGTAGELFDPTHAVEAFEDPIIAAGAERWFPSGQTGAGADPVSGFAANSDAITVRFLDGDRSNLDPAPNTVPDLEVTNSVNDSVLGIQVDGFRGDFAVGMPAAISDCGGVDVFLVQAVAANGVTANALSRAYDSINRALLAPFQGVRYFVRDNAAGVPALWRSQITATAPFEQANELVDGVQSLQLLYGVDTNADGVPDEFLSAGENSGTATLLTRNDFLSVVAVRIALLMRTIDEFGQQTDPNWYDVGAERFCAVGVAPTDGVPCTVTYPPDRRRRRVFQTTIALRNMQ